MHISTSPAFKQNAHQALADAGLQQALARSGPSFVARRTAAVAALPEFEQLRDDARDIKNHALANLDFYLEAYEAKVLECRRQGPLVQPPPMKHATPCWTSAERPARAP